MRNVQLNLTSRQANLIWEALRQDLIAKNSLIEANKNNGALVIELQSEAHVIRATIQAVKDELWKLHKETV
jgi:hypothetical protein